MYVSGKNKEVKHVQICLGIKHVTNSIFDPVVRYFRALNEFQRTITAVHQAQ